jgi:hypothetical protein
MPFTRFSDDCVGCRPIMVDANTGVPYADDTVEMVIVNRLWSETTLEQRQAWHRFTCQNSRALKDVQLVKAFADRLEAALGALQKKKEGVS